MQNHQADSSLYVWPSVWSADLHLFLKSVVIHDTECPYWDQVSLDNTKPNQPPRVLRVVRFEQVHLLDENTAHTSDKSFNSLSSSGAIFHSTRYPSQLSRWQKHGISMSNTSTFTPDHQLESNPRPFDLVSITLASRARPHTQSLPDNVSCYFTNICIDLVRRVIHRVNMA